MKVLIFLILFLLLSGCSQKVEQEYVYYPFLEDTIKVENEFGLAPADVYNLYNIEYLGYDYWVFLQTKMKFDIKIAVQIERAFYEERKK